MNATNQNSPHHRVCHCRGTASAVRWRHDDRGNAKWRDDGERSDGWNQLDVDSYFTDARSRCPARLGHLRTEEVTDLKR